MTINEQNPNHIIAAAGMTLQRISDGMLYGDEIYLGYTYYIGGQKLDIPKLETKDDFVEVAKVETKT